MSNKKKYLITKLVVGLIPTIIILLKLLGLIVIDDILLVIALILSIIMIIWIGFKNKGILINVVLILNILLVAISICFIISVYHDANTRPPVGHCSFPVCESCEKSGGKYICNNCYDPADPDAGDKINCEYNNKKQARNVVISGDVTGGNE